MSHDHLSHRLASIALILALLVVMLGAYTRLQDAGLGCPDWPGCYGHLIVPAQQTYPDQPIEAKKAWAEMVHRYVAGTLATLIFILAIRAWWRFRQPQQPVLIPTLLAGVVIFQAALGMWTVTLKLFPPIVMLHLLGGMSLVALLTLLRLQLITNFPTLSKQDIALRGFALFGLLLLIMQIALGAWTSTNYAALVCHDFPFCNGQLIPPLHFSDALQLWPQIGPNYQGGLLDNAARITIHMLHRYGALIVFIYWSLLLLTLVSQSNNLLLFKIARWLLIVLVLQICLGISNVVFELPLAIAVAHNGCAALLLLGVVTLNYTLWRRQHRIISAQ